MKTIISNTSEKQSDFFFSVITVVKNAEKSIFNCINSLNNQTFQNFEHIVIDGLSTDSTLGQIENSKKYENLIVLSELDFGIYDALNKGLRIANGRYILILHSDDYLHEKTTLQNFYEILINNPKIDVLCASIILENKKDSVYWNSCLRNDLGIASGWYPPHTGIIAKAFVYEAYKFDTSYKISSDYNWIYRVFNDEALTILCSDKPLVRMSNDGTSQKLVNKVRGNVEIIQSVSKISGFPVAISTFLKRLMYHLTK